MPQQKIPQVKGFTLLELLVAISIMAMMTLLGWRAIDGMQQGNQRSQTYTQEVLALEAGLAQWGVDLDAIVEVPQTTALDWDGRVLRLTRLLSADASAGFYVVAWMRGTRNGSDQWLRWQSEPVRTRQQWLNAWQSARQWSQSPNDASRAREVLLAPLVQWQIYFHRGGAWSNSLSSAGNSPAGPGAVAVQAPMPDGIRLELVLASPHPFSGKLRRDWSRPGLSGAFQ